MISSVVQPIEWHITINDCHCPGVPGRPGCRLRDLVRCGPGDDCPILYPLPGSRRTRADLQAAHPAVGKHHVVHPSWELSPGDLFHPFSAFLPSPCVNLFIYQDIFALRNCFRNMYANCPTPVICLVRSGHNPCRGSVFPLCRPSGRLSRSAHGLTDFTPVADISAASGYGEFGPPRVALDKGFQHLISLISQTTCHSAIK